MDLTQIKGLTKNLSEVQEGYVYFCFKGQRVNGHDFIKDAFDKGAVYVVGSEEHGYKNYFQVPDANEEMVKTAKKLYDFKQDQMNFIGITGTDGKTSTALIINHILNKLSNCAYLGTSGFIVNGECLQYNGLTTPFADDLYKNINITKNSNVDNFVMEVSSHALDQKRNLGLLYDVAIFTNISQDHLDYHNTMEEYFSAKLKIIEQVKENGTIIINLDDDRLKNIEDHRVITIGENPLSDYHISNISESFLGTSFVITHKNKKYEISTKLLAKFNAYNLVEAVVACVSLGYKVEQVINCCSDFTVEGRMQLFKVDNYPTIILDFAHTPDSIEKIMQYVNKLKIDEKIFVVMGSAGERDRSKRPEMGRCAAKYADCLILTEDDPRSESVERICADLKEGIDNHACKVLEIHNRVEALEYALNNASKNDIIMLLGKAGQKKMYYDGYTTNYIELDEVKKLMIEVK